jgi:hypothetical protein
MLQTQEGSEVTLNFRFQGMKSLHGSYVEFSAFLHTFYTLQLYNTHSTESIHYRFTHRTDARIRSRMERNNNFKDRLLLPPPTHEWNHVSRLIP